MECAQERGLLARDDLYLSKQQRGLLQQVVEEVGSLLRVAQVIRAPGNCLAPESLRESLRELLGSARLKLLEE